ncbi:unnamed protein product [Calypogeia fissa]
MTAGRRATCSVSLFTFLLLLHASLMTSRRARLMILTSAFPVPNYAYIPVAPSLIFDLGNHLINLQRSGASW